MLKHMFKEGYYQLRYKPSFNICNRNHYIIKDASMWNDYVGLLLYFHKDVRNAHYVCPKDLKTEHDLLVNKRGILRPDREENRSGWRRFVMKKSARKISPGFIKKWRGSLAWRLRTGASLSLQAL